MHTDDEKPYLCTQCDFQTRSVDDLRTHLGLTYHFREDDPTKLLDADYRVKLSSAEEVDAFIAEYCKGRKSAGEYTD